MKKLILLSFLIISIHSYAQHLLLTPKGHSAKINQLLYVNDHEALSCSDDNTVILWNIKKGEIVEKYIASQHSESAKLLTIAIDSTANHFFVAGEIGNKTQSHIIKCKIKGGTSIKWLAHSGTINKIKMLPNGLLVSAGSDSLLKIWKETGKTFTLLHQIEYQKPILDFDISLETNKMVINAGENGFDLFNIKTSNKSFSATLFKTVQKHFHPCRVVRFSPNGEYIVSGADDYLVMIYKNDGTLLKKVHKLSNSITDLAFSLDNQNILATILFTGEVSMIAIPDGKIVSTHTALNNTAQCVAFSPASINGNYESLVSGGDNHNINVFSAINGKLLNKLSDDTKSIGHLKGLEDNSIGINFDQTDDKIRYSFDLNMGTLKKTLAEKVTPKAHFHDLLNIRKDAYQVKINNENYGLQPDTEGRYLSYSKQDSIHILGYDNGAKIIDPSGYRDIQGITGSIRAIAFTKDKKWLLLAGEHQHIYILDSDSLSNPRYQPEFNLSITEEGEWVLWTKDGLFMGSDKSDKLLGWQMQNDNEPILHLNEVSSFTELLYRPDIILESITSRNSISDILKKKHESIVNLNLLYRSSPPTFNKPFSFAHANDKKRALSNETTELFITDTTDILLSISVFYGGGGIQELDLYQNGKLVKIDDQFELSTFKEEVVKEYPVRLLPGINKFKVVTTNKKNIKSSADHQTIKCTSLNHPVSDLHLLILGINEYKNPTMNLNYGVPDAKAISETLQKQAKGIYSKVNTYSLFNEKVTLDNIKVEISKIKEKSKITDVFVLYFAGHGIVYDDIENESSDFYMVLHDCIGDNIVDKGLSSTEMKSMLSEITANKQLVLIDACHSEASFKKNSNVMRRGLAEQQAIYQLARSSGTVIIAACGASQTAKEFTDLGHGAFTYAFIEAIEGAADGGRRDRKITVSEIKAYVEDRVPELTQKYSGTAQYPSGYSIGQDFPISLAKKKK